MSSLAKALREIAPEQVKEARKASGLTQAQAAPLVYTSIDHWQNWEQGPDLMAAATYELFLLKTSQLELSEVVQNGAPRAQVELRRAEDGECRAAIRELRTTMPAVTVREFGIKSLGCRIRTLREAGGLTQTELAMAIGVTEAAVSAWEGGNSLNLKLQTFLRILDVLGVTEPEHLIRGTDW